MGKSRRQNTQTEKSDRMIVKELRAIVRSQQKQLSTLKKQLMLTEYASSEPDDLFDVNSKSNLPKCPQCENPMKEIDVGKFILFNCKPCNIRIKKK